MPQTCLAISPSLIRRKMTQLLRFSHYPAKPPLFDLPQDISLRISGYPGPGPDKSAFTKILIKLTVLAEIAD